MLAGSGACYAGGNVGEGPGWWVVVFSAGLALGGMFTCWLFLNAFAPVMEQITVDRDVATGIRAGGFFVAQGLLFGRAVAGDWQSVGGTILDFILHAWPALLVLGLATGLEHGARLSPAHPYGDPLRAGYAPAAFLVAFAVADLFVFGVPK